MIQSKENLSAHLIMVYFPCFLVFVNIAGDVNTGFYMYIINLFLLY